MGPLFYTPPLAGVIQQGTSYQDETRVARHWQSKGLDGRGPQFVQYHQGDAPLFGAEFQPGPIGCSQDRLAEKARTADRARVRGEIGAGGFSNVAAPPFDCAMGPSIMGAVRRKPDGMIGRHNPGTSIRSDRQQPIAQTGELAPRMAVLAQLAMLRLRLVHGDQQGGSGIAQRKGHFVIENGGYSALIGSSSLAPPDMHGYRARRRQLMTTHASGLAETDLEQLYAPPSEHIQKAVMPELLPFHAEYLAKATFFCFATGRDAGLDASPRGGPAGFVHALDTKTVAFADWPGNNRIESMRNLTQDHRLGMLFLFPGLDIFMRINGRGRVTDEPTLCAGLAEGTKIPKMAIVVAVDEVLFHCGKAVSRARLWDPASFIDRKSLPTPGQMLAAMTKQDAAVAEAIDAQYDHGVKNDLYG